MFTFLSVRRPEYFVRSSRPALSNRGCALQSKLKRTAPKLFAVKQDFSESETQPTVSFATEEKDGVSRTPDAPTEFEDSTTSNGAASGPGAKKARSMRKNRKSKDSDQTAALDSPLLVVTKPLPHVLILHTGGTLGMDPTASYEAREQGVNLKKGTGGVYAGMSSCQKRSSVTPHHMIVNLPVWNTCSLSVKIPSLNSHDFAHILSSCMK